MDYKPSEEALEIIRTAYQDMEGVLAGRKNYVLRHDFLASRIDELVKDAETKVLSKVLVQGATGRKRIGVSRQFVVSLLADKQQERKYIWESRPLTPPNHITSNR